MLKALSFEFFCTFLCNFARFLGSYAKMDITSRFLVIFCFRWTYYHPCMTKFHQKCMNFQQITACGQKKWEKLKTLNGRLPPEDSSDFDENWTKWIVTTRSFILDALRFFRFFRRFRRFFRVFAIRAHSRTDERTNERTNGRTNDRTDDRTTDRTDGRTIFSFFLATDGIFACRCKVFVPALVNR